MRHTMYDNQSVHSCSEQECYGRSGFCDCDGDYEFSQGDEDFSCKDTDRYTRCEKSRDSAVTLKDRKAYRNVLCNEECQNYNCTYQLFENKDCNTDSAFDNFILYGATKYGDFPVQYTPNDPNSQGPCQYIDDPNICPGMPGAWRSIPQACDNNQSGPWHFKSVKINTEGCKVTIFDKLNQQGKSLTVEYDPSKEGPQCLNLELPTGMTQTRSAFSVEKCYTTTCTKKFTNAEYQQVGGAAQYRLAGRGVLWNDCVQFRPKYKEYCQDYGLKPAGAETCQLWDGAFQNNDGVTDVSQNILKNSTVISEKLESKFSCVIVDTCNLPDTHKVDDTYAHR